MSSFKRLVDIAKAEVGSVFEKAEKVTGRVSERVSERIAGGKKLDEFSDDELSAEIEKRRLAKQLREEEAAKKAADDARRAKEAPAAEAQPAGAAAASDAARGAEPDAAKAKAGGGSTASARVFPKGIDQYYANLEVEPGADLETIKRAYRRLMRKYHPDKHAGDPAKYKAATELAQSLTKAYMELKKHLEG